MFSEENGVLHSCWEHIWVPGRSLPRQQLTPVHQQSDLLCTVAENITLTDNIHLQQFSSNWASLKPCSRKMMTAGRRGVWQFDCTRKWELNFLYFSVFMKKAYTDKTHKVFSEIIRIYKFVLRQCWDYCCKMPLIQKMFYCMPSTSLTAAFPVCLHWQIKTITQKYIFSNIHRK